MGVAAGWVREGIREPVAGWSPGEADSGGTRRHGRLLGVPRGQHHRVRQTVTQPWLVPQSRGGLRWLSELSPLGQDAWALTHQRRWVTEHGPPRKGLTLAEVDPER